MIISITKYFGANHLQVIPLLDLVKTKKRRAGYESCECQWRPRYARVSKPWHHWGTHGVPLNVLPRTSRSYVRQAGCPRKKKWSQGISSLNSKAFLRLSSYYSCWILLTPIILNLQVSISPNDKIPYQALTTETFFQGGTPSFPQILNNIMVWMVLCTRLCCGTSGVKKYLQTVDPPFCG